MTSDVTAPQELRGGEGGHHATPARTRKRPAAGLSLNLTAMIDVVFLLLVYFMAATEFKLGEEVFRMDLPARGRAADPFELPREPLVIIVSPARGGGPGAYRLRVPGAAAQPSTFQELYEFLESSRRSEAGAGGTYEPDHPVLIQPAEAALWEHAVEAFNAAVRARYTNVTFAEP